MKKNAAWVLNYRARNNVFTVKYYALSVQKVILTKGVISATFKMQSLQNVSFLLLYSSIRLCNTASGNRHSGLSKQKKAQEEPKHY